MQSTTWHTVFRKHIWTLPSLLLTSFWNVLLIMKTPKIWQLLWQLQKLFMQTHLLLRQKLTVLLPHCWMHWLLWLKELTSPLWKNWLLPQAVWKKKTLHPTAIKIWKMQWMLQKTSLMTWTVHRRRSARHMLISSLRSPIWNVSETKLLWLLSSQKQKPSLLQKTAMYLLHWTVWKKLWLPEKQWMTTRMHFRMQSTMQLPCWPKKLQTFVCLAT